MQVFEFHFNPKTTKTKGNSVSLVFCYEPKNINEKKLGILIFLGALHNSLPNDLNFLNELFQEIKNRYYNSSFKSNENTFQECLKGANNFLKEEIKKENIGWLGNLNSVIASFSPQKKTDAASIKGNLNFTLIGNSKILLFRQGQIFDIGKKLDFQEIEPWPLKVFSSFAFGKILENDKILILSNELLKIFSSKNLLNALAKMDSNQISGDFFTDKIKEIFKEKEEISIYSGICLLIIFSKQVFPKKVISFEKEITFLPFLQDSDFAIKIKKIIARVIKLVVNITAKIAKNKKFFFKNLKKNKIFSGKSKFLFEISQKIENLFRKTKIKNKKPKKRLKLKKK